MFGTIAKLFGRDNSKSLAKSRLHFVLVQDRSGLSNTEMAAFRQEMVDVIQKYFVVNDKAVEVEYQRDSDSTTLRINSPVLRRRPELVNKENANQKNKTKKAAQA